MAKKVFLVGAGPGDPGLITEKAKTVIESADVIIHDSLINPTLLDLNKGNAEIINVGKRRGKKKYEQHEINNLLVKKARSGKTVVRLKGGDPFIFGRGGEEGQVLGENGIDFDVVPGVSSVSAVPAYSGIPLTHRDYNSSFTVITGHEDPRLGESRFDWEAISRMDTIVFLMSLNNTEKIMKQLLKYGKEPETPVSITSYGTTPRQRTITATVSDISEVLGNNPQIKAPAVTVVGKIVNLRKELNWFEKKPLFGKSIIVTRPSGQSGPFSRLLANQGAEVVELPTIEIRDPDSWQDVDQAIARIDNYDYIIFTSSNGVTRFFDRVYRSGKDSRIFGGIKIVTIGTKTASCLKKFGLNADYIPDEYIAEGIIKILNPEMIKNKRILIPRAEVARDVLPVKLSQLGAGVDVVHCYKTGIPDIKKEVLNSLRKRIRNDEIDMVTFTSSSTARNFFTIFSDISKGSYKFKTACIGPVTAQTVKEQFRSADIVARVYTVEGLAGEIISYFKSD